MSPRTQHVVDTEQIELGGQEALKRVAGSAHGMVASAHHRATEAGVWVLAQGGNAVDAAVATAFALGVCEPAASGLGGQTMMVLHFSESNRKLALDGSSRAPIRAAPEALADPSERRRGYKAATVPSTPAVLEYALRRFGTMPLAAVLEPAEQLAKHGYRISPLQHALAKRERDNLMQFSGGQMFLGTRGSVPEIGSLFKQPELAYALRRLMRKGVADFFTGKIAASIHADMEAHGGLMRKDDLAQVAWPIERRPVAARFGPLRYFSMPPPGAGRTLIEMLNILSHFEPDQYNPDTVKGAVLLVEVIRQAYVDRRDKPFDPHFYAQVDDRMMISPEYAQKIAAKLRTRVRRPSPSRGDTTHLSVMDRHANTVVLTQSIEHVYGSCCANPEFGFLYNSYMNAFEYEDYGHPYYMRPGANPWASVAPAIFLRGKKPWLAIGSPGSERIAPSILQVLIRILRGRPPFDSVQAPRLHCSLDGKVSLEIARIRDDIPRELERRGFTIDPRDPYSFYLGCVQLVLHENGTFLGVADPRRDGSAGGPG